ncbi:MAG TPA: tetratricopeptide repeat protein [Verrucomicrobiae bacterium]|jgi:tetratricopeptide (TPR) repeat protein
MEEPLKFQFELPRTPMGPLVEVSTRDMEKLLLKKLQESENNPTQALWQLALFYKQTRQHGKALTRLQELMPMVPDPEERAKCVLTMGQTMEQTGNYASAVGYYKQALALEPMNTWTWYFINNNLGFSLNIMQRFAEAEPYCRRAIQTDPNRSNAYKNLGLSLSGQGQYREAAQCYVAATQTNAADPRAFHLLMDLLKDHPELEYDFQAAAIGCRKAVETAARKVEEMKPVIHRGWKKRIILFRARILAMLRRLWVGSPPEL